MKTLTLRFAIVVIAGSLSNTAGAQSNQDMSDKGGDRSSQDVETANTALQRSDAQQAVDNKFTSLDTNRDGTLSTTEALRDSDLSGKLQELDNNGDNAISRAEFSKFEAGSKRQEQNQKD